MNGIQKNAVYTKALFEQDFQKEIEAFLEEIPSRWVTQIIVSPLLDKCATLALVPPKVHGERCTLQFHWGDFHAESAKPWDHRDVPSKWKIYLSLPLLLLSFEEHLRREVRTREAEIEELRTLVKDLQAAGE